MTHLWATALASLLVLSGCGGAETASAPSQEASETSSSASIPMDGDLAVTAAVRDAIADMKAADPNVNISIDDSGTLLTGDPAAVAQLATSITNKSDDGNVAMGKHKYCIVQYGPGCPPVTEYEVCHQGSYWNLLFANLDKLRFLGECGTAAVEAGSCATDCDRYN